MTAPAVPALPAVPADVEARAGVGLRSERGPVLAALMLSTGLVALDSTIIATAVPSVVRDLGGFSQFPWLFSIYLLTQAVTVPLYGKFADVLAAGRGGRPVRPWRPSSGTRCTPPPTTSSSVSAWSRC